MKKTLLAYFAGAIDSDGFVTVHCTTRTRAGSSYSPTYYSALVGFTNTMPHVSRLLARTFGGRVEEHQPKNPKHKRWYNWKADGNIAASALKKLLPYLMLKKRQAALVLKLVSLIHRQWNLIKRTTKPPYRIPSNMVAARRAIWLSVTNLNCPRNRRVHFATDR